MWKRGELSGGGKVAMGFLPTVSSTSGKITTNFEPKKIVVKARYSSGSVYDDFLTYDVDDGGTYKMWESSGNSTASSTPQSYSVGSSLLKSVDPNGFTLNFPSNIFNIGYMAWG